MTTMDQIPDHWINKAGIAKRIGKSRVTVDKHLDRIAKDPVLAGRLNVKEVREGKRTLYFFDPTDIDALFSQYNKSKNSRRSNVKGIVTQSNLDATLQSSNHLQHQLEKEELKRLSLEKEIARLEENIADLRGENTFLKAQLTDQRAKPLEAAYQPPKISVVPQNTEPNVVKLEKAREQKPADENEQEIEQLDGTLEEVMDHFDPTNAAEQTSLEAETATQPEPDTLASLAEIKEAVEAELKPEPDTQPKEAVDKIEDGAIDPDTEEEPAPTQKKGFWNWIKGY